MKQHDVIISGQNMELTDSIKNMVHEKAEKLF
jgi:ribosome-associated translation inhibitor RaiA